MQIELLLVAASGAGIAALASVADHRRTRRDDPDRMGLLPLREIAFAGMLAALLGLAFAIRN